MPLHMTSRGVLVCLATLAALCVVMDGPMLARLLPWLTGQCSPALGPVSRWNDWWGIGWLRFHNRLVREVAQADKAQVSGLTRRQSKCLHQACSYAPVGLPYCGGNHVCMHAGCKTESTDACILKAMHAPTFALRLFQKCMHAVLS